MKGEPVIQLSENGTRLNKYKSATEASIVIARHGYYVARLARGNALPVDYYFVYEAVYNKLNPESWKNKTPKELRLAIEKIYKDINDKKPTAKELYFDSDELDNYELDIRKELGIGPRVDKNPQPYHLNDGIAKAVLI